MSRLLRLTSLCAALAFVFGCQETSGPAGPGADPAPEFHHRPNHDPNVGGGSGDAGGTEVATFDLTFAGAVSGLVVQHTNTIKGGTRQVNYNFNDNLLTFSPALISALDPTNDGCFATSTHGSGHVSLKKKDGSAQTQFYFAALGTDGSEQDYLLMMGGEFDPLADWLPAVGGSNLITGNFLSTDGNASHPKCRGTLEGPAIYTILVERTG